jgi:hypothetical protein
MTRAASAASATKRDSPSGSGVLRPQNHRLLSPCHCAPNNFTSLRSSNGTRSHVLGGGSFASSYQEHERNRHGHAAAAGEGKEYENRQRREATGHNVGLVLREDGEDEVLRHTRATIRVARAQPAPFFAATRCEQLAVGGAVAMRDDVVVNALHHRV